MLNKRPKRVPKCDIFALFSASFSTLRRSHCIISADIFVNTLLWRQWGDRPHPDVSYSISFVCRNPPPEVRRHIAQPEGATYRRPRVVSPVNDLEQCQRLSRPGFVPHIVFLVIRYRKSELFVKAKPRGRA